MERHVFIQMSKLHNVKGRISYITSTAKQENLYATYRTCDSRFWGKLAKENRTDFERSGTAGECIEARELIIALPECYTAYQPQEVLKTFTDFFKERYEAECVAALHHNKDRSNYHIHLIFSERKPLAEPEEKIASRNLFYDKNGNYLPMKKVGKNNPNAKNIEANNKAVLKWNDMAARALTEMPPENIKAIKKNEIIEPLRAFSTEKKPIGDKFEKIVDRAVKTLRNFAVRWMSIPQDRKPEIKLEGFYRLLDMCRAKLRNNRDRGWER